MRFGRLWYSSQLALFLLTSCSTGGQDDDTEDPSPPETAGPMETPSPTPPATATPTPTGTPVPETPAPTATPVPETPTPPGPTPTAPPPTPTATPDPALPPCENGVQDEGEEGIDCGEACSEPCPPPDPATVAPPLPTTQAVSMAESVAFLYTGEDPIQTGVAEGAIDADRVAVVRGRVTDRAGEAIRNVELFVDGHPELGSTRTRQDGTFDLVVNGGGWVSIHYRLEGHLDVQRSLEVPWADFVQAPEVVLTALDPNVTDIDLTSGELQVAEGSLVRDADGPRQATLMFPPGVQASMLLEDGSEVPLPALSIRATEYTVGEKGPAAMPAALPPSSGYTYAVELSADEALEAGAAEVRFSQPVPFYLENFLGFPVGEPVPMGYYDQRVGAWISSENGRVIEVLEVLDGVAVLDVDGDGAEETEEGLEALGITAEELAQLGARYGAGETLWRVPIPHLTPWDCNWPYGPPDPDDSPDDTPEPDDKDDDPCEKSGSIIMCENQTLGEVMPLPGTPYRLYYQSDLHKGNTTWHRLTVPVTGPTVQQLLKRVSVQITVAGKSTWASFPAAPNQTMRFVWDGKDAYGRPVEGVRQARVNLSYHYTPVYYPAPADFRAAFARYSTENTRVIGQRQSSTITVDHSYTAQLGRRSSPSFALGGWQLDVMHAYEPGDGRRSGMLFQGDGQRREVNAFGSIITTFAGGLKAPGPLALAPDGSIYVAERSGFRIRRIDPAGALSQVTGTGSRGAPKEGTAAILSPVSSVTDLEVGPDGRLYFANDDAANGCGVYRIESDGKVTRVAGSSSCFGVEALPPLGEGVAATAVALPGLLDIAVASDGRLYLAQAHRILRMEPDGTLSPVAGNGDVPSSPAPDGVPATGVALYIDRFDLDGTGNLYFEDLGVIRRVGVDGVLRYVAGEEGLLGFPENGALATATATPASYLSLGSDNSLYAWYDPRYPLLYRIDPAGRIEWVAGNGQSGFGGDGDLALNALFSTPVAVAEGPDGSLYVSDSDNGRVRRIGPADPVMGRGLAGLPSPDGQQVFLFDVHGRHAQTIDALTGVTRLSFGYDTAGRVTSIADADGMVTTIERDGTGAPVAVVAPNGARTELTLEDGYLSALEAPDGGTTWFDYRDGLLTWMKDARGYEHRFEYDADGRLTRDENGDGGFSALEKEDGDGDYKVTVTTAEGLTTAYVSGELSDGSSVSLVTAPDGTTTQRSTGRDGEQITIQADGTKVTTWSGPDPRWGYATPVITRTVTRLPSGLTSTVTRELEATFSDPALPLSVQTWSEVLTRNGKAISRVFDVEARTDTRTSAMGRTMVTVLDSKGRPAELRSGGAATTRFSYDEDGRLERAAVEADNVVRETSLEYGEDHGLSALTDAAGGTTRFARDPNGRVTERTLPDLRVVSFEYDHGGNLEAITPPGRDAYRFTYNGLGQQTSMSLPDLGDGEATVERHYDLDGRLVRIVLEDDREIHYSFDDDGRFASISFDRGVIANVWDEVTGDLLEQTAPGGEVLSFEYDGPLLLAESWSGTVSGEVRRQHDTDFRTTALSAAGQTITFDYDDDGLLTRAGALAITRDAVSGNALEDTLGEVTTTRTFDDFGDLDSEGSSYRGEPLYRFSDLHDALGRIVEREETIDGQTHTLEYEYDLAGRLVEVRRDEALVESYEYDENDNRIAAFDGTRTTTGEVDGRDRLLSYGGTTFGYNEHGDLVSAASSAGNTLYQYDALGNLVSVTAPGGRQITYVIDARGRRVGKRIDGQVVQGFLYHGQLQPVAELDGQGRLVSRFVYGGRPNVPDYMIRGGRTYRILSDQVGSPRLVVDVTSGEVALRRDYDAFGRITRDTAPGFLPFGFAGGLFDADTGLTLFGARSYDAALGRWTTRDPLGFRAGRTNLYLYAGADPLNRIDPTGLVDCDALKKLVEHEKKHGKDKTVKGDYSPLSDNLYDLNHNYDSIYGPVDMDWMLRTTGRGAAGIGAGVGNAIAHTLYLGGKVLWNTVRAASEFYDLEYKSVFEDGNWNAPTVANEWLKGDKTLEEIMAPALKKCEEEECGKK